MGSNERMLSTGDQIRVAVVEQGPQQPWSVPRWMSWLRDLWHVERNSSLRSQLQQSPEVVLSYLWMFFIWTGMVCLLNGLSLYRMQGMSALIASANVRRVGELNRCSHHNAHLCPWL
jgi:hypothetical protein